MAAAIGALGILVASLLIGRALIDLLVEFDWPVVFYIVLLALVGYGPSVVWGFYVRNRWADGKASNLGWRFRWSDLGWGPLTYLAALGCEFALFGLVDLLGIPLSSNVDDVNELGVDRAYLVATVITAVIAAPVVEELVFRGVVLRGFLSRFAPVVAIALAGSAVRCRPRRPGPGRGEHRSGDHPVGCRSRARNGGVPHATDRHDDRRPRDLQRRRDDHRPVGRCRRCRCPPGGLIADRSVRSCARRCAERSASVSASRADGCRSGARRRTRPPSGSPPAHRSCRAARASRRRRSRRTRCRRGARRRGAWSPLP